MLHRLLVSFHEIGGVRAASVHTPDGGVLQSEGVDEASIPERATLCHEAHAMAEDLGLGGLDQVWIESTENTLVAKKLDADHSLWIEADSTTPIGRLRHSVDLRAPVINDLI